MDEDSGKASNALRAMGLNIDQLKRASPEGFLRQFAGGLANVADQNQRTAIAIAVLGKSGADTVPVIAKLASDFEKLRSEGLLKKRLMHSTRSGTVSHGLKINSSTPAQVETLNNGRL
jgi:hypothetical protein